MKVFTCPEPTEAGKFQGVIEAFPNIWEGAVLDVGCRSANLRHLLTARNPNIRYVGLDLYSPASIIGNLEEGLPFHDKAFDVVVALDVLEHTDRIHGAFDELCRVTRKLVVVALPNMYELKGRIKFLLGTPYSGKYGLPTERPVDRHRWVFSLNEARAFVHGRAGRCDFQIRDEGCLVGPRRTSKAGRLMIGWFPNLLSPWYLLLLGRS